MMVKLMEIDEKKEFTNSEPVSNWTPIFIFYH